uniref:Uncharacterized protein n=1 Tax=Marseillevirus LCMAC103 TaxID=2506604 RepID=A0A481YWE0_9VIRU|nr:MAG: uncharacterized protein LCMAC103_02220 [Marseillevirus LCMAC103]
MELLYSTFSSVVGAGRWLYRAVLSPAKVVPADVDGHSDLVYWARGKQCRVRFPLRRGPSRYARIVAGTNPGGPDVTAAVETFLGPSRNFYGIPTTPAMLGYEALTFVARIGRADATFAGAEVIRLP